MKYTNIGILTTQLTLLLKGGHSENVNTKNTGRYLRVPTPIESLNQTHIEDRHDFQEQIDSLNFTHTNIMNNLHNQVVLQNFTFAEQISDLEGQVLTLQENNVTLNLKLAELSEKSNEQVEALESINQHLTDQVLALQQQIEGIHNLLQEQKGQNHHEDPNAPKLVFLSSGEYSPETLHGSLENTDSLCQELADAENLPGTYKAWLSISSTGESPSTRFTHSEHGYVLVDMTTMVADNWGDLIDGTLLNPINKNEKGEEVGSANPLSLAWTWTDIDGTHRVEDIYGVNDCSSTWGRVGNFHSVDSSWTATAFGSCNVLRPIYCFQQ